jgi:hypothetical protein
LTRLAETDALESFVNGDSDMSDCMMHTCASKCECRKDLDAAAAELVIAARFLRDSIPFESDEGIERWFAVAKVAWAKTLGAHADYLDHFAEA